MLMVNELHKTYQAGKTKYEMLKGISFEVEKGEFVAVMGQSGSGKTILLNCISCYIPSDAGKILLGNTDLASLDEAAIARVRNEKLGFVFQDFLLLDGLTVRYLVSHTLRINFPQISPAAKNSVRQWRGRLSICQS